MKKVFFILLFLGLLGGCERAEYDPYIAYGPSDALVVNEDLPHEYSLGCEADTVYVAFKSDFVWIAEVEKNAQSWLTVEPSEGKKGDWTVAFIVKKNGLNKNNRAGDITISAKNMEVVFTVNQSICTNE